MMYSIYECKNRTTLIHKNILISWDRRHRCYYYYYYQTFSVMTFPNTMYRISDLITIKTLRKHIYYRNIEYMIAYR